MPDSCSKLMVFLTHWIAFPEFSARTNLTIVYSRNVRPTRHRGICSGGVMSGLSV